MSVLSVGDGVAVVVTSDPAAGDSARADALDGDFVADSVSTASQVMMKPLCEMLSVPGSFGAGMVNETGLLQALTLLPLKVRTRTW